MKQLVKNLRLRFEVKMGKCPECQKEEMVVIGTEKFSPHEVGQANFSVSGIAYDILVAHYCKKCNVIFLREPKKVYG